MPDSVGPLLAQAARTLPDSDTPRLDAEVLLAHVLDRPRAWLLAHPADPVAPDAAARFTRLLSQRQRRVPVAYLTGTKEFGGRDYEVTPDVLVPRPESERLVELTLEALQPGDQVWDVGTGSGCLAVTIKLARPDVVVTGSDVSPAALAVARRNAARHGADLVLLQTDLCPPLPDPDGSVVVANLPYVPRAAAARDELAHEPALALDGGLDGFDQIRRLLDQLVTGFPRVVLLEIDPTHAARLHQRYPTDCRIVPDLAGTERFAILSR